MENSWGSRASCRARSAWTRCRDVSAASSPLGSQQIKVRFALSASPEYVADQRAIYLRDLELISVQTAPANIGVALTPILPTFNNSLSFFLLQTPVYRLDSSRKNKAKIKDKVKDLKVEPGRLVIPFKVTLIRQFLPPSPLLFKPPALLSCY